MQKLAAVIAAALCAIAPSAALADDARVGLPRFPSISPDGAHIVYSWHGDLWKVPATGGHSVRLTSHPAIEGRSAWSPDGRTIAFISDRDGYDNIFVMNADGSGIRQITHADNNIVLTGFSPDGSKLLFASRREGDVYRAHRPYHVSAEGGPISRVSDAFAGWTTMAPGGDRFAMVRGESRWSRRHYRGPDNRDVWLYDARNGSYEQLTQWDGNDARPRWKDRDTILFLSDRDDRTVDLYAMDAGRGESSARRLTRFADDDIREFDVSRDGRTVALVAWDTLYTLDLSSPGAEPSALRVTAPQDATDDYEIRNVAREVSEATLSPDGQVMAFIAHGDVYIRNVDDDMPSRRVTDWPGREREPAWSPDGLWLYFSSDQEGTDDIYRAGVEVSRSELKDALDQTLNPEAAEEEAAEEEAEETETGDADSEEGEDADADAEDSDDKKDEDEDNPADRWHDAMRFAIEPVVQTEFSDRRPSPSPDGSRLLFRRTRGDMMMMDLETGDVSTFRESWNSWIDWTWSPDGQHVAFSDMDVNYNSEVFIQPADGSSEPVNISMHPDNDGSPRFSADGRVLAFLSERQNDDTDVWMVFLDKELESYTDLELKEYFEDAKKAAGDRKPLDPPADEDDEDTTDEDAGEDETAEEDEQVQWTLDDAYLRLRQVTRYPGNEGNLELAPAGNMFLFTASGGAAGDGGLFVREWGESDSKRLGASASVQHLTLKGNKAVIVRGGRAATVALEGGDEKSISLDFSPRIDLEAQMSQMFHEAARELGMRFYHPTMKGLDWDRVTDRYHTLALDARTGDEFAYIAMRLFGELNGSHLGAYPPGQENKNRQANGRLGVDLEPVGGERRVRRVIPFGPADNGDLGLLEGDLITAIDFEPLAPQDTVAHRLKGKIGDEVVVTVERVVDGSPDPVELSLLLTPISYGAETTLRYNNWQRHNAALVDEWSGGRIGYLHIRGMSQPHLEEFERDLYAAGYGKDGLLIDVRSNGGGWTADRVLGSIMVRPHAYTVARGDASGDISGYPQDRLFIQRWTKPVNMLCNEKSFSNAEIVSHAFKTLGRGTLVGQQTYGGVISTGGFSLIDGTWVRLPFRGWFVNGGMDMENNGAMPDIVVDQTPEDESAAHPYGYDRQLETATKDLMRRLDR